MNNHLIQILIFLFLQQSFLTNDIYAQNLKKIDSLKTALKQTRQDTEIVNIYNELSKWVGSYDLKQAMIYAQQGLGLAQKTNYKKGIANAFYNIGNIHFYKSEYSEAIENFNKAVKISEELKSLKNLRSNYEFISKAYSKLNNYEMAYRYHLLFKKINDSIYSSDNTKKLTQLEMTYNFEKKQHEQEVINEQKDQLKKSELNKQKIIKNTFLFGFILTILLSFLVFRSYRLKYKANILLVAQKKEINEQKEEIISKNNELTKQKEEIIVQRDLLDDTNKELRMINVYLEKLSIVRKDRNVAVIITDNKGKIEWVNDDFIKLYGVTKEEYSFHHNSILERSNNKQEIIENLKNNNSYTYETIFKSKSKEPIRVKVILIPVYDRTNQLIKLVAVETEINTNTSV